MERLNAHGGADLAPHTVSCSNVRDRTRLHTHCGSCSQCLDRRFAMLAAGLSKADPAEMYETGVLDGARDSERDRTMAVDWTSHADALGDMDEQWFMRRFTAELTDLIAGFPDRAPWQVFADALALHRRHGKAVRQVLATALASAPPRSWLGNSRLLRCSACWWRSARG